MEEFKKYLAIDYGKKRIGLALGAIYPSGMGVIDASKGPDFIISEIKKIAGEQEVSGFVIGIPVRSQGEAGTLDQEIKDFAKELSASTKLGVYFENEQFSSVEAERQIGLLDKKIKRKTGEIDEMAAVLILEQFLNRKEKSGPLVPDIQSN